MLWELKKRNLTLRLRQQPFYEIDLERCTSSAEVLDWIIQVSKKTWANDAILSGLVRRLDECLDLQGNVCGNGIDHSFDVKSRSSHTR